MLNNKDDYVYVSQDALKNVSIKGSPYPARKQKLVPLGEDIAYLQEAISERKENVTGPSGGAGLLADYMPKHTSRILKIGDLSETIKEYVNELNLSDFFDPDKIEENGGQVSDSTSATSSASNDNDAYYQEIANIDNRRHAEIERHSKALENLKKQYENEINRLRDVAYEAYSYAGRWVEIAVIVSEKAEKSRESEGKDNEKHEDKLAKLKDDIERLKKAIDEDLSSSPEDIDRKEEKLASLKADLIKLEDDFEIRRNVINNAAIDDIDNYLLREAKEWLYKTNRAYEELERVEKEYKSKIRKENKLHSKTEDELSRKENDIKYQHYNKQTSGGLEYSNKLIERAKSISKAALSTRSCAATFLETHSSISSATPMLRLYADLERMRLKKASLPLYSRAWKATFKNANGDSEATSGGCKSYIRDDLTPLIDISGNSLREISKEGYSYSTHSEFFIMAGGQKLFAKDGTPLIDKIVVDVVHRANFRDSEKYDAARDKYLDSVEEINKDENLSNEEKYEALEKAYDDFVETQKMFPVVYHNALGIERVEFKFSEIPHKSLFESVDALWEQYKEQVTKLAAKRVEAIREAAEKRSKAEEKAGKEYNKRIKEAAATRRDAVKKANRHFVESVYESAKGINSRIKKILNEGEEDASEQAAAILKEFKEQAIDPARQSLSEQIEAAKDAEDDAVADARKRYDGTQDSPVSAMRAARIEYDKEVKKAKGEYDSEHYKLLYGD